MNLYILKDAILPVGFGVVIIAILFIMKGALNFIIGVPLWIIGIVIVFLAMPTMAMFTILISFYRFGPEGFVTMECRREGRDAVLNTEIGTGVTELMVGVKRDPKDPIYTDEKSGVKVDPSMVSQYAEPLRLSGGLNIFGFAHNSMFPQTTKNHLAFKGIIEYFDENSTNALCEDATEDEMSIASLDFLTIKEKIELIMKPEHFLEEDMRTKVGKYFKQRKDANNIISYYRQFERDGKWFEQVVEIPRLIHAIQRIKSDLNKRSLPWGYYCMTEAFKYNNVPYTAQHLASLKMLLQQLRDEYWMKLLNWMQYGMIIIGIIGITILGIYVLGSTVFK